MTLQDLVYLDSGPVVSLAWDEDKLYGATKEIMSTLPGRKTTSYLACLEAFVVLRRVSTIEGGVPPSGSKVSLLWNSILDVMADAEVEVSPIQILDPLDHDGAMDLLRRLGGSPTLPRSKKGNPWIRGVGVMDCLHLKAAEALGATHFLTNDTCLSELKTDMVMLLVGDHGGAADVVWPALMLRHLNVRSGETGMSKEEALTS